MLITLIAAIGKNGVIGKNNRLVWHIPPDLKHFKEKTMGHHLLLGRKTYESLPSSLPGRTLIILSKNKGANQSSEFWFSSLQEAIKYAKNRGEEELFIIGGSTIFAQTMQMADKLLITEIDAGFEGDVFFPKIEERIWQQKKCSEMMNYNGISFSFKEYRRRLPRKTRTHEDG